MKPDNKKVSNIQKRNFLKAFGIISSGMGLSLLSSPLAFSQNNVANSVKALTFDVFGTVVDWRSSIIREGQILSANKGFEVD